MSVVGIMLSSLGFLVGGVFGMPALMIASIVGLSVSIFYEGELSY